MDLYQSALNQHQKGNLPEAVRLYQQALSDTPNDTRVLANLASALGKLGQTRAAFERYQQVLKLAPDLIEARFNFANLLFKQQQIEEAEAELLQVLQQQPAFGQAEILLANIKQSQSQTDAAIKYYQQGLQHGAGTLHTAIKLAVLLYETGQSDHLKLAAGIYQQAIQQQPDQADHYNALGAVMQALGDDESAEKCWLKAIQLAPQHGAAFNNLGVQKRRQGDSNQAKTYLERAIAINPRDLMSRVNLADVYLSHGLVSDAVTQVNQALDDHYTDPERWRAENILGMALTQQARIDAALAAFERAHQLHPQEQSITSNLLFSSLYSDQLTASEIGDRHRQSAKNTALPVNSGQAPKVRPAKSEQPLRVGYLSADLKSHPVSFFFEPVLEKHDPAEVHPICYSLRVADDITANRLKAYAADWRECGALNDQELAELIRRDNLDILVDLGGHTARNRLNVLRHRPAPIQMHYIGYPCTTGLPEVDYLITDAYRSPPDSEALYSEKLLTLPDNAWCYRPPDGAPEVSSLPALSEGVVRFGSFNHAPKLSRTTIQLWSQVLADVPKSELVLGALPFADQATREHFLNQFEECGIARSRVRMQPPVTPLSEFLKSYHKIDIALDPVPYNGGTTTCEALWMGVPVVTMAGEHYFSRMGHSFMKVLGLDQLSASTPDQYVEICGQLADDLDELARLRSNLRSMMAASPLCDGEKIARNIEAAFRSVTGTD